jgi:hypothetical protein
MTAAADVISEAVSGASGCECTAFAACGLADVANVPVDISKLSYLKSNRNQRKDSRRGCSRSFIPRRGSARRTPQSRILTRTYSLFARLDDDKTCGAPYLGDPVPPWFSVGPVLIGLAMSGLEAKCKPNLPRFPPVCVVCSLKPRRWTSRNTRTCAEVHRGRREFYSCYGQRDAVRICWKFLA